MSFPEPSLFSINAAILEALSGISVPGSRNKLTAENRPDDIDKVADDRLPYLLFDIGSMTFSPWQGWERSVAWDVAAVLKVKGEPGETDHVMLRTVDAILQRLVEVTGLPVDEKGHVVAYTDKTARLFDQGRLRMLADRGAPYLSRMQTIPSVGAYAKASLTFHVEAVLDLDPRKLPIARQGVLGIIPVPPGQVMQDATLPAYVGIPIVPVSADRAWTAYNSADPEAQSRMGGALVSASGPAASQVVTGVNVTPYSAALSVGTPTAQLSAIAFYANGASSYVTSLGAWSSSATGVATVSASGLVTRVAAGSATITCTFNGVQSNAVAVTCS